MNPHINPQGIIINHKLEASGGGQLSAGWAMTLAALVPENANVRFEHHEPSAIRKGGSWSWCATWPLEEDDGEPELPRPSSAAEPLAAYADGFVLMGTLDGTNDPRCVVVSDARVERFGYAVGVQCELQLGHSPLRNGAGHKFAKKADQ